MIEKAIKNAVEFSSMLNAAPVFCTKIKSNTRFDVLVKRSVFNISSEKYISKTIKNIIEIFNSIHVYNIQQRITIGGKGGYVK